MELYVLTVKEKINEVIQAQPDDATYEEIVRELLFERMIERGCLIRVRIVCCQMRKWNCVSEHGENKKDN